MYGESIFDKESRFWKNLSLDHCTETYDKLDGNKPVFLQKLCQKIGPHHSILELGCNTGAVLFALAEKGYSNLSGVEINAGAVAFARRRAKARQFPIEIFHHDFPGFFREHGTRRFDWAITYGATLELLHPAFDIFSVLGRVINQGVLLCLDPDAQKFPRWYDLLIRRHFPFAPKESHANLLGGMRIYEGRKNP